MKRPAIFTLTSLLLLSLNLSAAETRELFNGKDLSGWKGDAKFWSVQDGAITGTTKPSAADEKKGDLSHNTFLVWEEGVVGDFELTLEFRMNAGNSGIQYRSKELQAGANGPILSGYQADFEAGPNYSGILYEERGRGILALRGESVKIVSSDKNNKKFEIQKQGSVGDSDKIQASIKQGDWNTYRIVAKGNRLQHFINDLQTVDVVDEDSVGAAKEGKLGLQIHTGPPMQVQFKNLVLKTLP